MGCLLSRCGNETSGHGGPPAGRSSPLYQESVPVGAVYDSGFSRIKEIRGVIDRAYRDRLYQAQAWILRVYARQRRRRRRRGRSYCLTERRTNKESNVLSGTNPEIGTSMAVAYPPR